MRAAAVDDGIAGVATERLEAEACTIAAQLAAATCRFLAVVGELDDRETWRSWGCRSMAHWLSWRCGLGLHAAREQVRVARALRGLPQVREAFGRGELSYSKVRALSRIATAAGEGPLVEFAQLATAAQVDRTVGAYAGVRRNVDPDRARLQHEQRAVRVLHNDDGTVTITARLAPDAALTVLAALDQAQRHVVRASKDVPAGTSRADALELVARAYIQPDPHARAATQIVIHTDANVTVGVDDEHQVAMPVDAVRPLACDAIVRRVRDEEMAAATIRAAASTGRRGRCAGGSCAATATCADGEAAAPATTSTSITSRTGSTAAPPTPRTSSCCAATIIDSFTTATGRSPATPTAPSRSSRPTAGRSTSNRCVRSKQTGGPHATATAESPAVRSPPPPANGSTSTGRSAPCVA
jgi:hypothetical protein